MSRWQPHARERLEEAALELYTERGFDQTTVDDIARRAGLTERTFFRHFADKREVLFSGQSVLIDAVSGSVAEQPNDADPLHIVAAALSTAAPIFDARGDRARQRQAVIAADRSLQERELLKLAAMADALTEALRRRGIAPSVARLAAEAGVAVFRVAFGRWVDGGGPGFGQVLDEAFADLRALAAAP